MHCVLVLLVTVDRACKSSRVCTPRDGITAELIE
ncbi:hypothetical protein IA54_002755 [Xanthomonas phaseoli pv. syngonii LMG 9055]|uniref:Uncharacterized protein n=1 Tax=Xanthomonas phaseoli pv. syngonii LMG 9055 TaxID=1437878 RepID=A0A1V9HJI2_9XANT|nr:hypothetical protein IA54_002755 [Xanthomonas phaseoli pv. syngonii LMG 9055]